MKFLFGRKADPCRGSICSESRSARLYSRELGVSWVIRSFADTVCSGGLALDITNSFLEGSSAAILLDLVGMHNTENDRLVTWSHLVLMYSYLSIITFITLETSCLKIKIMQWYNKPLCFYLGLFF